MDRIPIIGWIGRRRDSAVHGNAFWVRPMLIEIACAAGLPWFFQWLLNGGLIGASDPATPLVWVETWFYGYSCFIALMCIGTFIDFDERTIPDEVTVTGTLVALVFAAFAPWFRLPELVRTLSDGEVGFRANTSIESIHFMSPLDLPQFHHGGWGLTIALSLYAIWIWALMPKLPVWYVGFRNSIRFMYAHAIRPKRKNTCAIRTTPRAPRRITILLGYLFVIGLLAITGAWYFLSPENWTSLFGALLGMAFGGGLIWVVRIVGTYALQKEAMGFGDVTLMAMIGAFLGWQAALLVFVIAPFAALAVVAIQFIVSRDNMIAFGPYLCAGAVVLMFQWHWIWPYASVGIFALGPVLLYILLAALVLMVLMLLAIQWFKGLFYSEYDES